MTSTVDGRSARRSRNRDAVLDAVLELFAEGNLTPSPDEVARRSGVSLRSVYRYVADADDLIRSAVERHTTRMAPLFAIDDVGEGSFEHRLDAFVAARTRGYEATAATARAARLRAPHNAIIAAQVARGRAMLRAQTELQFAPEIAEFSRANRHSVVGAVDALTQIDTLDLMCHACGATASAARDMLRVALRSLLQPGERSSVAGRKNSRRHHSR